ncbi:MAG: diadenosine tetraphosphate hydrolase [Acidipropionibacterium sp.]|jgi:diadenosine tetraphosphate (Ap4A) HIT family hydrolase|nr:diadenosine tetraphosphate hydrolase [Acidipropionibacterium sp.]
MRNWRADRVGSALRGHNPTVIAHLSASFAAIGDVQFLPGYCIALTDQLGIHGLSDLSSTRRLEFLADMELLGRAVEQVCRARDPAFRRINLEILGNTDPTLHAHVWPRYDWEPPDLVGMPVWLYPQDRWTDPKWRLSPAHDDIRSQIAAALNDLRHH